MYETKVRLQNSTKTQSGFSIIEVVVTLFIIGLTLVLLQMSANSVVLNKQARYKEIATRIADQKMQSIRTTDFDSIPSTGTFNDSLMSSIPSGAGNITVVDVNDTLKDVTVRVTWSNSRSNGNNSVELQTYITEGGLGQ
ncbi:prepilin-type N-terminal cleavage/methylation domain-containing protein [bacterium]|nr:MAG: prepilin-type N-terminal cleavage/methylation domain-containing protein [bacterium]